MLNQKRKVSFNKIHPMAAYIQLCLTSAACIKRPKDLCDDRAENVHRVIAMKDS